MIVQLKNVTVNSTGYKFPRIDVEQFPGYLIHSDDRVRTQQSETSSKTNVCSETLELMAPTAERTTIEHNLINSASQLVSKCTSLCLCCDLIKQCVYMREILFSLIGYLRCTVVSLCVCNVFFFT